MRCVVPEISQSFTIICFLHVIHIILTRYLSRDYCSVCSTLQWWDWHMRQCRSFQECVVSKNWLQFHEEKLWIPPLNVLIVNSEWGDEQRHLQSIIGHWNFSSDVTNDDFYGFGHVTWQCRTSCCWIAQLFLLYNMKRRVVVE